LIEVKASVEIARPVDEVFHTLTNPDRQHVWQHGLVDIEHTGGGGVGTKTLATRKFLGRRVVMRGEIVEHVPSRLVRVEGGSEHFAFSERTSVEPAGAGTRVTLEIALDTHGALQLAAGTFQRMLHRDIEASLQNLKDVLEAHKELEQAQERLPPHRPRR
jgi:carbon monoxide dehydrogenase subunit G